MYGKRRQITPYTCHEVLERLHRGGGGERSSRRPGGRGALSWGTDEAGWDGAETVGIGPDVTGTTAGEEPAITEAWAGGGAEGPSEEEGSFATERPKLEEDVGYPCWKNNGKPGLRTGIHHKSTKKSVKLGKLKGHIKYLTGKDSCAPPPSLWGEI